MHCPRCDGSLTTFAVEATERSAVVCESCGFAGVATSHHPEEHDAESWEQAIQRFEETGLSLDRITSTDRTDSVSIPTDDSGPDVDPDRFEESVTVATALREETDTEEPDDPFEESVTVAAALGEDSDSEESESDTDSEESGSDAPESDVAGAATDDSIAENYTDGQK